MPCGSDAITAVRAGGSYHRKFFAIYFLDVRPIARRGTRWCTCASIGLTASNEKSRAMTDDTTKFWDTVDHLRVAMMTTQTPNGLESRPMSAYVDKDAHTITFITRLDSSKIDDLQNDAHVNLAFADTSANKYVSVTGTARVARDPVRQKALWNAFAEAWMPEGPEAPTTALIDVTPATATIWDSPGKIAMLIKVARANLTQTPPHDDNVTRVTL